VSRPAFGYVLILLAVSLLAVNATVAKVAIESGGLSALRLAELRAAGAALLLFGGVALARPAALRVGRRDIAYLAVFGVCGLALAQYLYFVSITRLDIGIALLIANLAPVLIALWARFVAHEPVRRRLWVGLALAFAGLTLVVELWSGITLDGVGLATSLLTALSYAVFILMADHRLAQGGDVYALLAWGFVFASFFWAIVQPWWSFPFDVLARDASLLGRLEDVSLPVWSLGAYVIVLGAVVPFSLLVSALRHVPPTRAVIVAMSELVLAGITAYAWLGEELGGPQIAGGILVLVGIVLAQTARAQPQQVAEPAREELVTATRTAS
jgi:drug/metabolite transporter (DMT)-like permease